LRSTNVGKRRRSVHPVGRPDWADLTEEDLADEVESVSDEWAADYEQELDRRDTVATEGYALADAEPDLFRAYRHEFIWPRISARKCDPVIAERKGYDSDWRTRTVSHRGHIRYRVERHLDPSRYWHRTAWARPGIRPSLPYWLALHHGIKTRNVTIDIDSHGPILATFRRGFPSIHPLWPGTEVTPPDPPMLTLPDLSVEVLEQARRLHGALGAEARWCLSSRCLGFHAILPMNQLVPSHGAVERARRLVSGAGLPSGTEVYPCGGHLHRLPFGLDFSSFRPGGDLAVGFVEQMRMYLKGKPAPVWDDLLEGLLRHWRGLLEEASWHVYGARTWRNLHARIRATDRGIERWRTGSSVPLLAGLGTRIERSPYPRVAAKVTATDGWTAYVEGIKAKSRHYWLSLVQDLARNGMPCHDCIDRAARELGRFPVHVQGLEAGEAADLVCRWAESKSNGYITRLQDGKAGVVRGQIHRIVSHVAGEEDFGGRLARMCAKLVSGGYRNPIDLPRLMMTPADQADTPPSPSVVRKEKVVILVDKDRSSEGDGATWGIIQERMAPHQPGDLRRRPTWWRVVRSVVSYLRAHGGEAPLPKTILGAPGASPRRSSR
jgi:hypothetical protein